MLRKDAGAVKIRDFDLELKSVEDDGSFKGYGSVFGEVDSDREIVAPGAFDESLARLKQSGRKLPILWQHKPDQPIGVYDDVGEDAKGLRLSGRLLVKQVRQAAEAHALAQAGAVTGLSIGYYVRGATKSETTGVRTLTKLDLFEVSLVTFPSNDSARVDAVKMKIARGGLPTIPEFEVFLREAGFSKSQRAVIANRGLAHLLDRSESGSEAKSTAMSQLAKQLGGLSLPKIG